MTRDRINQFSIATALAMSCMAVALVLAVLITGWERHLPDEGVAAHMFQLLIAAQLPLLAAFVVTIDRARLQRAVRMGFLEACALAMAFGCVAWFHL